MTSVFSSCFCCFSPQSAVVFSEEAPIKNKQAPYFFHLRGKDPQKAEKWMEFSLEAENKGSITYTQIGGIGEGGAATLVKVQNLLDSQEYALKIPKSRESWDSIWNENRILHHLGKLDPEELNHIMKQVSLFLLEDQPVLLLPFYSRDLSSFIKMEESLSLQRTIYITKQLLEALEFLKLAGVIHLDIKPKNILMTGEGDQIKLIDFGGAFLENTIPEDVMYTFSYASPETLCRGSSLRSFASDMWSTACTVFFIYSGKGLFAIPKDLKVGSNNPIVALHFMMQKHQSRMREKYPQALVYQMSKSVFEIYQETHIDDEVHSFDSFMDLAFEEHLEENIPFKDLLEKMLALDCHQRIAPKEALTLLATTTEATKALLPRISKQHSIDSLG